MKTVRKGSKGANVKAVQKVLNKSGARPALSVDGVFGNKTETALKAYQKKHKLKVDGIAGEVSLGVLGLGPDVTRWPLPDPQPTRRDVDDHYLKARNITRTAIGLAEANHSAIVFSIQLEMQEASEKLDKVYGAAVDTLCKIDDARYRFEKLTPTERAKREKQVGEAKRSMSALVDRAGAFFGHIVAIGGIESAVRKRKRVKWDVSDACIGRHKALKRDFDGCQMRLIEISDSCTDHKALALRKIGAEAYEMAAKLEKAFADFSTSVAHIDTLKQMFDERFLSAPDDQLLKFIAEAKKEWPKYLNHDRELSRALRHAFDLSERHKRLQRDRAA